MERTIRKVKAERIGGVCDSIVNSAWGRVDSGAAGVGPDRYPCPGQKFLAMEDYFDKKKKMKVSKKSLGPQRCFKGK